MAKTLDCPDSMQTACSAKTESLQVNETKDFLQPPITATMSYHLWVVYTNPPLFFAPAEHITWGIASSDITKQKSADFGESY